MRMLKLMAAALLCIAATTVAAQEPAWNASAIKECDRACLVGVLDGYLNALFKKDPKAVPPLAFSMLTCSQQIDSKIFAYMKHIRPRRALILDEQKQTVGTFPLFVHDGTRRGAPADAPPGMLQNLVTMETFSVRGGVIHHVEAAPFVTLPYGLGNGWTSGSGR